MGNKILFKFSFENGWGDISFTSLFNWCSINIKKVKLTNIVV